MSKNKKADHLPSHTRFGSGISVPKLARTRVLNGALNPRKFLPALRHHSLSLALLAFLSLGVLGAGLKYLEADARRQQPNGRAGLLPLEPSLLNLINPFLAEPPPSPPSNTPLTEYIYAGSRLLATEQGGASSGPAADLAVWRPSTGVWWVMDGNSGSQQATQSWGISGDVPVPGDYDGDGKTDFSIFRPSANTWWVLRTGDGNFSSINFGTAGDRPAAADFDGDGRTDLAVYRPSNGTWYVQRSSDLTFYQQQFGLSTDRPNAADYDGDGRADPAVWRDSTAAFYSLSSGSGQLRTAVFPQTGGTPLSADYDGDGRADYAVRYGAAWSIRQSSNYQLKTVGWEQPGDVPVPNDYDGDGKVDIAVWRPSNGIWFIRQSSNGQLRQNAWGVAGDIPVPAFYRR